MFGSLLTGTPPGASRLFISSPVRRGRPRLLAGRLFIRLRMNAIRRQDEEGGTGLLVQDLVSLRVPPRDAGKETDLHVGTGVQEYRGHGVQAMGAERADDELAEPRLPDRLVRPRRSGPGEWRIAPRPLPPRLLESVEPGRPRIRAGVEVEIELR